MIALALVAIWYAQISGGVRAEIPLSRFLAEVDAGNVEVLIVRGQEGSGKFRKAPLLEPVDEALPAEPSDDPSAETPAERVAETKPEKNPVAVKPSTLQRLPELFLVTLPGAELSPDLIRRLEAGKVEYRVQPPFDFGPLLTLLWIGVLGLMVFSMWSMWRRARDPLSGGGMLGSVVRSPARKYDAETTPKVTFDDVAGLKGAKRDLKEIVEFLRDPEKFQRLGAQPPKGVLLNGPPGTGKTLLARAVAGEAGAPFYSVSGSEFIQLFVGVGASRVRDLFKTARRTAPAIIFIDEIDAIGRQRGAGLGGGHDEREQTLNQILSEMDGFSVGETVVVMAATNRPDVLDPALLRPGRFDRHITVDRPTIEGREQLFEVHSKKVPVADDVDFKRLARATTGLTGAEIKNLVNEAALWATRHDQNFVTMDDFEYARDKVLMGDFREEILTEEQRRIVAYHESGHALVGWLMPGAAKLHKVTILPRGRALGVTHFSPDEDIHNTSRQEIEAQLAMALGGRTAEKLVFDEVTVGAESDLKHSTRIARRMVTHWGMSERLGPVSYATTEEHPFLGREIVQHDRQFSEHTMQLIDDEVAKILHTAADRARRLLTENRDKLEALAQALLEKEEVSSLEVEELIGPAAPGPRSGVAIEVGATPTSSPN